MVLRLRILLFLILLVFVALPLQSAEAANFDFYNASESFSDSAPKIDLMEMIQECPDFSAYPKYDGVIWLKEHTYQIDSSGLMSVTTVWVILGKSELERKWLDWNIQIPKGGDAQIYEASLYDPGSLTQIDRIEPQRKNDVWHINFRTVPDEFIIVLSYRQSYAHGIFIQDMLWLNESLPIWEHSIIANVETGREFEYVSNSNVEPEITNSGNHDIYKWMIVNQTPVLSHSLRTDSRIWLAFGNKQPLSNLIKLLEIYEKMQVPLPPSNVEAWLKKGDLSSFFNWLLAQEIDNSINRAREEIPERAPWSKWEKSILASSWINRYNKGSCRLFWRLSVDPAKYNFANESIILNPVMELKRKKDTFFYDAGQPYEPGLTSLSLIGEALYIPNEGNKLEKRLIPPRGASVNRLSIIWNISLAEDNTMTGSVRLIIRNSWKDFLLSNMNVNDILREIAGKAAFEKDITTKNIREGIEIIAPLKPSKIILGTSGTNAIIPLTPPQPDWLRDLGTAIAPYSIKFPMSVEINYKINLPANVKDVLPPTQIDRDGGKIKYLEKYEYFRRSKRLDVTARLTFPNSRIDQDSEKEIAFAISRFGSQRSIPIRIRD
ncbi:MAG: hypothetical protein FWF87_06130 [Synergistaceae bacterium]|nr:hypothetical protein [Synergistaceae bacterium]